MQVGLAMFTVRKSFAKDPFATLEKIADIGYRAVELANHRADKDPGGIGVTAKDLKKLTTDLGIKILGAHFVPENRDMIDSFYRTPALVERVIEFFREAGAESLAIPIDFYPTRDYLLRRCEVYNAIGERCHAAGMKFLYHNHYHEYQRFNGEYMMDTVLKRTDPRYVFVEVDTYWMFRGALDPVPKMREYGSRIALIHQKDFPLDQVQHLNAWLTLDQDVPLDYAKFHSVVKPEYFIEVGEGIMKIQEIIDVGNELKVPYILIEQDNSKHSEMDSAKRSLANMKKMRGLEFPSG